MCEPQGLDQKDGRVESAGELPETEVRPTVEKEREHEEREKAPKAPRRFHGAVELDPERVGRDASQIADEVIAHLTGIVGADVRATLEIEAKIPGGANEQVVRTVTENCKALKFQQQGFESD
jgi:hypothetical protein